MTWKSVTEACLDHVDDDEVKINEREWRKSENQRERVGEKWWLLVLEGDTSYIGDWKLAEKDWNWFGS